MAVALQLVKISISKFHCKLRQRDTVRPLCGGMVRKCGDPFLVWPGKALPVQRGCLPVTCLTGFYSRGFCPLCFQLCTSCVFNIYQRAAKLKRSHSCRRQHNYKGQLDKTYNLQRPAGLPNKIFTSVPAGHPERAV